jgi:poly-gamma-glutamate capsule biosynthesis protein CapA/YwtB (metallophosphatase superfamily)
MIKDSLRKQNGRIKIFISLIFIILMNCVSPNKIFFQMDEINGEFSFAAVGDIMVHSSQLQLNYDKASKKYDFDQSFQFVTPYLSENDFVLANLETTITKEPKEYSGYPEFASPPELVKALKRTGFQIISTANNHTADKGKSGILTTLDSLAENGLVSFGSYRDSEDYETRRNLSFIRNEFNILFYNYTYGTNGKKIPEPTIVRILTKENIRNDLESAKFLKADLVVVVFHYGTEYIRKPSTEMKEWVEFAIFEGADIVIGGHPHVLQKFEIQTKIDRYGKEKERLIFYSMGNFLSGQRKPHTDGGAIFRWNARLVKNLHDDSTKVRFNSVHYIPTWVYPNYKNIKPNFAILPIQEFLNEDGKQIHPMPYGFNMNKVDSKAMETFYKSTIDLLGDPSGVLPFLSSSN